MVRKVTLSVKIQAKVNFEGMGAKPQIRKKVALHDRSYNDEIVIRSYFPCRQIRLCNSQRLMD